MSFQCPKCGHQQDHGAECVRCGIVFARYGREPRVERPPRAPPAPITRATQKRLSLLDAVKSFYRVFRWVALAGSVLVFVLILRPAAPPEVMQEERARAGLERKIERVARGERDELRVNEAELNSWMSSNLALADAEPPARDVPDLSERPSVEEVQTNVRDVKIKLEGDQLTGYVLFELYGQEISLTIEGRLEVANGYLRLEPTAMKLGSLPIPRATFERAVRQLFESPENREMFRIPSHIQDIRIDNGALVVSY